MLLRSARVREEVCIRRRLDWREGRAVGGLVGVWYGKMGGDEIVKDGKDVRGVERNDCTMFEMMLKGSLVMQWLVFHRQNGQSRVHFHVDRLLRFP